MTNWKETNTDKSQSNKPEKIPKNTKAQQEWKKVEHATEAVHTLKKATKDHRKPKPGTTIHIRARRHTIAVDTETLPQVAQTVPGITPVCEESSEEMHENKSVETETSDRNKKGRRQSCVVKSQQAVTKQNEAEQPEEDPLTHFKHKVYQSVKNASSLAYGDDGELRLSVDNVFPLLKVLGLNPQSECVVDLVREAGIENFGEIVPADFETVVLGMVKEQDGILWAKRLEEKERLRHKREADKAKAEAERLRLEQEREKAGFKEEEEQKDEWAEYERKKAEAEEARKKEIQDDELYDNLRMAFKFIDADDDGVITTHDLYVLMMGMGEMLTDDELLDMVTMADTDCDGKVTFEDFKKFLLPSNGDESLIISQAAASKQLLDLPITVETSDTSSKTPDNRPSTSTVASGASQSEEGETSRETAGTKLVTDNIQHSVDNTHATRPDTLAKDGSKEVKKEPELSEEEKARRQKRRQSMLWGYMTSSKSSTDSRKPSLPSISSVEDEVFNKSSPVTPDAPATTETKEKEEETKTSDAGFQEVAGQLDAIREEDEHSNYGIVQNDETAQTNNDKQEAKFASALESKRKQFSRQSSAASLITKNTDSFGDSGVETMDSINCSEIRDQPDVFDESDIGEGEEGKVVTSRASSRAIYDADEDDEDMIDPLHVHESLSRVSSSESLPKLDLDSEMLPPNESSESYSEERIRHFVNEHTYMEIEPVHRELSKEELEQMEEMKRTAEAKIQRAKHLEEAILKRSFTAPSLTVCTSKLDRPQTARPSLNGISCSHIDIDLSCEAPPKAEIKSYRQFAERVKSARSSRHDNVTSNDKRSMSIIDISNSIRSEESSPDTGSRQKWPMRPLTRPRSPLIRRVYSPSDKQFSLDLESDELDRVNGEKKRLTKRRAKSAVPFRRSRSPSTNALAETRKLERPQTASLPYTRSKLEDDKKRAVLVVEPLANANELYPNKSMLTTYHHGFKSIWPIGRKINMIQNKRPFKAFEMNSYSRSIERCQFPFKADHNIKMVTKLEKKINSEESANVVIGKCVGRNVIKLEMETEQVKKPAIRKLSLYITPNSTPRAVR